MLITAENTGLAVKAKLFRGLGDGSRLSILDSLRGGPLTVGEIVEVTGLTQSNVSNHLGCLRDCGLVVATQSGRYVTYQLSDDRVGELIEVAEALVADVARGVYACTRYNVRATEDAASQAKKSGTTRKLEQSPAASNNGPRI